MKRTIIGAVFAAAVLTSAVPAAASTPTAIQADYQQYMTDLGALVKLSTRAHPTAAWAIQLKAVQAAEQAAYARLEGALNPPKANPNTRVVSGFTQVDGGKDGIPEAVTLDRITDPVTNYTSYNPPAPNTRYVSVMFTITDLSKVELVDQATNDASVIGSNGQVYSALESPPETSCTEFADGQFSLTHDESATGCVIFDLPATVKVIKVQWGPRGQSFGQWTVKPS